MSIELKQHNLIAYNGVKEIFENGNRAAVIHPTGTGKSFVALKLIEENPDKKVIYLSPSIPIMIQFKKNMIENGVNVRNVKRISYQKLTSLHKNNALNLQADLIILDEFHHCGAPEWGKAVSELLEQNENAQVLGLSATPVRYLDDEVRDMAEELFDNNVASEMTLEETIASGILSEPIYTTGLYEYQEITSELEEKIEKCSDPEKKKVAQDELEKLRKMLESAVSGLPEMLENTMTNKSGRYIVYCKDIQDMEKKMEEASKLFGRVNPNMEIMSISSRDEDIRKDETTIRNFEKETDDGKLKLLFSVNMLNEGYHLSNLDGVIMMRPTHSPTLYYQQLGRALSVGNDKQPIVIDLVNNIDTIEIIEGFSKNLGKAKEGKHREGTVQFSISEETREIRNIVERIDELVSRRGLSNEEKLRLMTEYMNETGEKIVVGTVYKGYNLGILRNNLRYEYNKGTLKMDEDLLKAFIRAGIILEQKERVRTSVQEKYDFLISAIGKSPEERKDMVMKNGLSYSEARNWIQLQYNRGSLKLSEDQIAILRINGILNMSPQERENLEKKYEGLLKHGIDLDTVLQLEKEYGSFEALMGKFKASEKKYEDLKKYGISVRNLFALEKEHGSFEEFMVKFKKGETYYPGMFGFDGFRGITISSREITEQEKLRYAKIVARIDGSYWEAFPEETNTIAYNSGWYIDIDEFDKAYELLDSKEQKVLDMFYGVDGAFHTEKEISEAIGFGRGVASRVLNNTTRKLSRMSKKWLKNSKDMEQALKDKKEKIKEIEEKLQKIRKMRECITDENGKQKFKLSIEDLEKSSVTREEFEKFFEVKIEDDGSFKDISKELQEQRELKIISEMTVEELDLSVRSYNVLKRAGINTSYEIIELGQNGIKGLRNGGRKVYKEIIEKMQELGFEMKEDVRGESKFEYVGQFCMTGNLFEKCDEVIIKRLTEELDRLNSEREALEEEQSRYKRACEVYERDENILDPNAIVPAIGREQQKKTPDTQVAENEEMIQAQQSKVLIERLHKKRAIIKDQETQIANLQEEKNAQVPQNSQQH